MHASWCRGVCVLAGGIVTLVVVASARAGVNELPGPVPYLEFGVNAATITDTNPRNGFRPHYRTDFGAGIGLLTRRDRFPDLLIGLSYDRRGATIDQPPDPRWDGPEPPESRSYELSIQYLGLSFLMQQPILDRGPRPFFGVGLEFATPIAAQSRTTVRGAGWVSRGSEDITSIVSATDLGAVLQVGAAFRYGGLSLAPTVSYVMSLSDVHDGSFRIPENPYGLNYGASRAWRLRIAIRGGGGDPGPPDGGSIESCSRSPQ